MDVNELDIERYLLGEMDNQEAEQFQVSMKQNKDLADEVALQQALMNGIINNGSTDIKATLERIHQEIIKGEHQASSTEIENRPQKAASNNTLYYIIGIVIFAIAGYFLYNYWSSNTVETPEVKEETTLFAAHYQPYSLDNVRNADSDMETQLIKTYQNKDYDAFLQTYGQLSESNQSNPKYIIARGTVLLERDNTAEALALFYSVYSQNELYKDAGLWYTALCHLKDDNISIARDNLQRIVSEFGADNPYVKKAQTLLGEL